MALKGHLAVFNCLLVLRVTRCLDLDIMADSNATDALAQETANLHLDEVTGERISKSELKKRQKARDQEKKKKEKAAAAPPKPEKKSNAEMDEANLNPNVSPPVMSRAHNMRLTSDVED